jgi:hypothetical protein
MTGYSFTTPVWDGGTWVTPVVAEVRAAPKVNGPKDVPDWDAIDWQVHEGNVGGFADDARLNQDSNASRTARAGPVTRQDEAHGAAAWLARCAADCPARRGERASAAL